MLAMRFDDPRFRSKPLGPGVVSPCKPYLCGMPTVLHASGHKSFPRKCESRPPEAAKLAECTELIGGVCDLASESGSTRV